MNQPWLSVLIPTYNGEAYLASALDSIALQQDPNIECIVVDDGSKDSTISLLKSYQQILPLKIFQKERYGNWVASTNFALSQATGDYVCLLHQDDIWLKNRLKIIKQITEKNPHANFIIHAAKFIDSRGKDLGLWQCPLPPYPQILNSSLMLKRLLVQNFIAIPAPIFKREIAQSLGGWDEKLWYTADWDFWLKIAVSGQTIYYPQSLAAFRVHPQSQTFLRSSGIEDFQKQLTLVLDRYSNLLNAPAKQQIFIKKLATFSIEVNSSLAEVLHTKKTNAFKLLISFLQLGPWGWHCYLRDSRIGERVFARVKARLA